MTTTLYQRSENSNERSRLAEMLFNLDSESAQFNSKNKGGDDHRRSPPLSGPTIKTEERWRVLLRHSTGWLLEVHLQRKLNNAGVRRVGYIASLRADCLTNRTECSIRQGHVRIGPLRMVEDIKELATELEVQILMRR